MREDDRPSDREPESAAVSAGIALIEGLEHALALLGRDALALIRDPDLDGVLPRRDRDRDLAVRRGEAGGVLQKVGEHLVELHRVGGDLGRVADHRPDSEPGQPRLQPVQNGFQDLVHRHRLLRRGERAGLEAGEVEQVAEETVEPVGLLQHRLEQVAALRVVVRGVVFEQTRDRRLDRGERRPQVMRDRGEQGGPRLVGLRVEPGHVHLRVEPGPLQCDRDLSRGRFEQPQVLAADRRLSLGADHDQRPEHLAADVEGEPALLAGRRVLAGLDDLVRAAPRPGADLASREVQRPEQ